MVEEGIAERARRLIVVNLSHTPREKFLFKKWFQIRRMLDAYNIDWLLPALLKYFEEKKQSPLYNINFQAKGGQLTALLGAQEDRDSLIKLIAGQQKSGRVDGNIFYAEQVVQPSDNYYKYVAYVQKKNLYIPGFTYMEMLTYSVRLRMVGAKAVDIRTRVQELLDIMNLNACRDRIIPEYPSMRGEAGGDLKKLSIAIEIAALPPIIVLDEPIKGFDIGIAMGILESLRKLTLRGIAVICSFDKVAMKMLPLIDNLVLLSGGYSIYTGSPRSVEEHFCGPNLGYVLKQGVNISDFMLDVASGVERPTAQRGAELPAIMQEKFEQSPLYEEIRVGSNACSAFADSFFKWYGYARIDSVAATYYRSSIVIERAFWSKIKDKESLKVTFGGALVLSLLLGYLEYGNGTGRYCASLLGIPYAETTNIMALLFVSTGFTFFVYVLNVHVICEKLRLFRYERNSGCCSLPAFGIATLVSEIPFSIASVWIYGSILYFLVKLDVGSDNFFYWIGNLCMFSVEGLTTAYLLSSLFRREFAVREAYLSVFLLCVLLSGFVFQLSSMTYYISDATVVNPLRWNFEALMKWKLSSYDDGNNILGAYGFSAFQHLDSFAIISRFIATGIAVIFFLLLPEPIILHKGQEVEEDKNRASASRDSMGSFDVTTPLPNLRPSEIVRPLLFMRESSVTGRPSNLSINHSTSHSLMGGKSQNHGPTVMFQDVTFRVRDVKSPVGFKTILNNVNGQFDWGKLGVIMGASESGRSSLLHFLGGDTGTGSQVQGTLLIDGVAPDPKVPLWLRCGLVEARDEHFKDLTVKDIVTYALKLRCDTILANDVVEESIAKTLDILHLENCVEKKVKNLTAGEVKRLSIAEELVHGPSLLLIDEPTTGLNMMDSSVLLMTFREMVNADRTVIATVDQPSAAVFQLFDTLMLLSKGRVIYHGPIKTAAQYFMASPFGFDMTGYNNPADYLVDISGGFIKDKKGETVDSAVIENYYRTSEQYAQLRSRFVQKSEERSINNPIARIKTEEVEEKDSDIKKASSIDISPADDTATVTIEKIKAGTPPFILYIIDSFHYFTSIRLNYNDTKMVLYKGWLINARAWKSLIRRYELVLGSCCLNVLLGCLFGWIMGPSGAVTDASKVVAYFALGAVLALFANLQYVFYIFGYHQVFLKETSRGLYSNFMHWIFGSNATYFLRAVNSILFTVVGYSIIELSNKTDIFGYFIVSIMFTVLSGLMLCEALIAVSSTPREVYVSYSGVVAVQFLFSGLLIKSSTMPDWLSPWVPSISVIRWAMQGNFLNTFGPQSDEFTTAPLNGYSTYTGLLNLFGWGGKSKWYCFQCIILNVVVFRVLSLLMSGISSLAQKGGRKFRKND